MPLAPRRLVLCLLLISAGLHGQQRLDNQAPDWLLSNAAGEYVSYYQDSDARASLLLFWTPACDRACLKHIAHMQHQAGQHEIKTYLLLVSGHNRTSELPALPGNLAPLFKAQAVARHYGVRSQPTWVLVDSSKTIVQTARIQAATPTFAELLTGGAAPASESP